MKRYALWAVLVSVCAAVLALPLAITYSQQGAIFGINWQATYFNNATLTQPQIFSELLPNGINANFGAGSPNPAVPVDNWSARYTSIQQFNQGVYEFTAASDDGIRVFIDNILVLDRFVGRVYTTDRFQQTLTAGSHVLTVEYFEGIDNAAVQFYWTQISGVTTPGVPTPFGTPFDPFATPSPVFTPTPTGPQGSVAGARGLALRSGPYTGASFITTILPETTYSVLGRNRDEGIYNWYFLQVGERQGWASGRYLQVGVPINTIPEIASPFDAYDGAPDVNAIAITRAVMNMRRRPSTRTAEIASIPWGATMPLIGRTVQAGQNRWLQVRYNGQVGWIDSRWVTVQGEIFNVPIR